MSYINRKDLSLLERLLAKVSLVDDGLAREGKKMYDRQVSRRESANKEEAKRRLKKKQEQEEFYRRLNM